MANSNLYTQLAFRPALYAWELSPDLEALAQRMVASGRLRLNADSEKNFFFHAESGHEHAFSYRELTDAALLPHTRERLRKTLPGYQGDAGLEIRLAELQANAQKLRRPDEEIERKAARVLVQSAHPAVIALLLAEQAEIFVSFAHTVGDLMPIHHWSTRGEAGGLQVTDWEHLAVYVSCGGNPFFTGGNKTYESDGAEALARFITIAAQELGHYADLIRTQQGITGRYSALFHPRYAPSPACKAARDGDRAALMRIATVLLASPLPALAKTEEAIAFLRKHRGTSPRLWGYHALRALQYARFWLFLLGTRGVLDNGVLGIRLYPRQMLGQTVLGWLADMQFNLHPTADAYRDPDPLAEEATLCVESLARVPQQVAKWGHAATQAAWPKLYTLYYDTVVPGVIAALAPHGLSYRPERPLSGPKRAWAALRRSIGV
jgi:hypothetical protein